MSLKANSTRAKINRKNEFYTIIINRKIIKTL